MSVTVLCFRQRIRQEDANSTETWSATERDQTLPLEGLNDVNLVIPTLINGRCDSHRLCVVSFAMVLTDVMGQVNRGISRWSGVSSMSPNALPGICSVSPKEIRKDPNHIASESLP